MPDGAETEIPLDVKEPGRQKLTFAGLKGYGI